RVSGPGRFDRGSHPGPIIRVNSFQPDVTITASLVGYVAQAGVVLPRGIPAVTLDVPVPDCYLGRLERHAQSGLRESRRFFGAISRGNVTCDTHHAQHLAIGTAYPHFDRLEEAAVPVPGEREPFLIGAWLVEF